MNSVEDQVRAATRAEAGTLREVRPLRLPPDGLRELSPRVARAPWTHGWGTWLAPVTAAAAVLALALTLVVVRDVSGGHVAAPAGAAGAVPRYYVALSGAASGWYAYSPLGGASVAPGGTSPARLVVGETLTGKRLVTIAPPAGSAFAGVTGAADDRTFVVSTVLVTARVSPPQAMAWYLLRITPGGAPGYRLTRLAIPDTRSLTFTSMALSGSGRELAMMLIPRAGATARLLRIYSVATGKLLHAWYAKDSTDLSLEVTGPHPLTWADGDRAVVFQTFGKTTAAHSAKPAFAESERLLDVASDGAGLIADSRVIWSQRSATPVSDGHCVWGVNPLVTADGNTVMCQAALTGGGLPPHGRMTLTWLAYSAAAAAPRVLVKPIVITPRLGKVPYSILYDMLWSDTPASTQIVALSVTPSPAALNVRYYLISHGTLHPLPPIPGTASEMPIVAF